MANFHSAHEDWAALSELGELVEPESKNREDFIAECKSGKLDGVVACYRTFQSAQATGLFDKELVAELPKSLKFVCHNGKLTCSPPSTGFPPALGGVKCFWALHSFGRSKCRQAAN